MLSSPTDLRPTPALPRPRSRDATLAGVLLSLAGVVILLGFITAEALYPGRYTTHTNTVSHLAASEPPASVVLQPSAAIFHLTMVGTGAMILAGAWFAARGLGRSAAAGPAAPARPRRGRDRTLDHLPYRPVAGRLRQLPAAGSGLPARWMKRGS